MSRPAPLGLIRLYTGLAGVVSAVIAVLAVPELVGPRGPGREWQVAYAGAAALLILWAQVWMGRPLRRLPATPSADPMHRRLAHDFPGELATGGFVGALLLALGTTAWQLGDGRPAGAAIATGALAYVVALVPGLVLYLVARRLLRHHAAGPPGSGPVRGARQALGRRFAMGVQVPVIMGAVGLLLVQQANSETYAEDASAFFADRLRAMRAEAFEALPDERARAGFDLALPASVTERMRVEVRPELALGPLPFLMLGGVILLVAVAGRRLVRTVTEDLGSIGEALRFINDEGDRPPPPPSVALRETTAMAGALEATLTGLAAQRAALLAATAERRRSDAAKARFLAHLSHELKSPLNSILGFGELLITEIDGPIDARQRAHLATLWRSGDALLRFILALLDLSRFEGMRSATGARASGFKPVPTTAAELARVLRRQLRPDPTGAVDISVALHPPPGDDPPRVVVDPAHTARALYVAAGRLLDAMDEGEVEIALHHPVGGGVDAVVDVVGADGEAGDREALVAEWRSAVERLEAHEGAGAAGAAPVEILYRLSGTQGGEVAFERFAPWPRFRLRLPTEIRRRPTTRPPPAGPA